MSPELSLSGVAPNLIEEAGQRRRKTVISSALGALAGERSIGKAAKLGIQRDLETLIAEHDQYQDSPDNEHMAQLTSKLLRFRPRMVGAMVAYSQLTNESYSAMVKQQGIESFYMFWALGSIQDDFIDEIPKLEPGAVSFRDRRAMVGKAIFGEDKRFYRAAYRQLNGYITDSEFGPAQAGYIKGKVHDWYKFLTAQEADVLEKPFADMDFEYCREYREQQNLRAGSALAAMLNGTEALAPERQALEPQIARFSYLSQIMDDIADTAEDLQAERPSYSVGALIDSPAELRRMSKYIAANPKTKVTPAQYNYIAPNAYRHLRTTYKETYQELQTIKGGRGVVSLARGGFYVFPYLRNAIYKVNPAAANF